MSERFFWLRGIFIDISLIFKSYLRVFERRLFLINVLMSLKSWRNFYIYKRLILRAALTGSIETIAVLVYIVNGCHFVILEAYIIEVIWGDVLQLNQWSLLIQLYIEIVAICLLNLKFLALVMDVLTIPDWSCSFTLLLGDILWYKVRSLLLLRLTVTQK